MSEVKLDAAIVCSMADRLSKAGEKGYFDLYREAAEEGDANAAFRLGFCYANGLETDQDDKKAFVWFEQAAGKGHPQGLFCAALCYAYGRGTDADTDKALLYARKSLKAGNKDAAELVYKLKEQVDREESLNYDFQQRKMQDIKELRRVISQIVSREFVNVQFEENRMYLEDIFQPKMIYNANTLELTRIRAEFGDDAAMLQLGRLYLESDPKAVNPSVGKAYYWLMKSAKAGNIDALKNLAQIFAGDLPDLPHEIADHEYAWELVRLLSWIHIDGLITIREWYEAGRFLPEPNYVQMMEACRGILNYRVNPKKYRRGWKELYQKEKDRMQQVRMQTYMDLIICALRLSDEGTAATYTRVIKETIERAIKENGDIFGDLAAIFIYLGREDLLEYMAVMSKDCSRMISEMYEGRTVVMRYRNALVDRAVVEVDPNFAKYFRFRYLFFAREKSFRELLSRMAEVLTELYYTNTVDSMQRIVKVVRTFNSILEEHAICNLALSVDSLNLLRSNNLKLELWKEDLLHDFKLHILEQLMAGKNSYTLLQAMKKRFVVAEMCFPNIEELFPCLPIRSNREGCMTRYEELIHRNYDLSTVDFSATNRFDICFDEVLWQIAKKSKAIAGAMMRSRSASWELPANMELELDRKVEQYLDQCDGKVCGYWPTLEPIYTVHYNRQIDGRSVRSARSLSYMDSWEKVVDNPIGEYIRILQENPPESDRFIHTLRLLYRYFAFRICWYEAVYGSGEHAGANGSDLERDLHFRKLHQKWKKQYLHFVEMVVQYVECH